MLRAWETDRGPQYLAYDAWWHLNQNTLITSEWGTPSMIEDGVDPELLLGRKYGHAAARAQAVRRGAAAGHRHQPVC